MLIWCFGVHSNAPTLASFGLVEHVDFGALVFIHMLQLWLHTALWSLKFIKSALWSMLILVFWCYSNALTLATYGLVEHVDFDALVFIQMLQLWLHTALWSLMFIKQCTQMLVTGHVKAERIRLRGIVQLHYDAILTINCMHLSFLHRHGPWP